MSFTHSVRRLYRSRQVESLPHVNVSVKSARIRHFIFGRRQAQDGLQVPRLSKNPSFWRQGVAT